MARPATGIEHIEAARQALKTAKTADELRVAQAVLLPLELGLSLADTGRVIGRSVTATCRLRREFCAVASKVRPPPRRKRELRNRAHLTFAEEATMLNTVLKDAAKGGGVVIPTLHAQFEAHMGHSVDLSTLYRMLARHGWRKLAPDTAHPQGDPALRENWKKNSPINWHKPSRHSPRFSQCA